MTSGKGGEPELIADADRPGGWILLLDRILQSYVDLEDPTYLDFPYVQALADGLEELPPGPLDVVHIGGGAGTLARYVHARRPGSRQTLVEPDPAVVELVCRQLPFPIDAAIEIRLLDGASAVAALPPRSADAIVVDAFHGGRVPAELTDAEFFDRAAAALRPAGLLLMNVADGPPLHYLRRLVAAVRTSLSRVLVRADQDVLAGERFGNVVLGASFSPDSLRAKRIAELAGYFEQRVISGSALVEFVGDAKALTRLSPMRSPIPPDELWRVGGIA